MFRMIILILFTLISTNVFAAEATITAIPKAWKLQNYIGNTVVVWFTGSPCSNGHLKFGASATSEDKNRFWSLIMATKVANKEVTVFFEDSNCEITSFSFDGESS